MIFDTFDITFLKFCGLCRYMPTGMPFLYDSPFMQKNIVNNLQEHGLIKTQSDGSSYKLTTLGRNFLAGIGYTYPADARMDLHKKAYKRKLINAEINLLLYLAGFDVFYLYPQELAGIRTGYASSLTMRADKNNKVLSGSKFLGLLKIDDAVYIPYFVEDETEWVLPNFERSMILSQVGAVQSSKKVKLLLFGRNTEALWRSIHAQDEQDESAYGRKRFYEALQEMGFDYTYDKGCNQFV